MEKLYYLVNYFNKRCDLYKCIKAIPDDPLLLEYIDEYLKLNPDLIKAKNSNGQTLLVYACIKVDSEEIIKILLKHNVDVNELDYCNHSAILYLIEKSSKNIKLLLNSLNINLEHKDGLTTLMYASQMNEIETVKWLIKHGADINMKDTYGKTALFYLLMAPEQKHTEELIKIFIENGAKVNTQDVYRKTPLMYASYFSEVAVRVLLEKGAKVNLRDMNGRTALFYSTMKSVNYNSTKLLLEHGADIGILNREGKNVLLYSIVQYDHNKKVNSIDVLLPTRRNYIEKKLMIFINDYISECKYWKIANIDYKLLFLENVVGFKSIIKFM